MKNYAFIEDGKVSNVIIWDGESDLPFTNKLVEIPQESPAGIDWDYIDGEFIDNRPIPEMNVGLEEGNE